MTAYALRISDWSSDVCSSDLLPPCLASAWRLDWMAPPQSRPGVWRAFKLIMLACTLNMVLPSKMGDIAKAAFLRPPGERSLKAPLALVVFEQDRKSVGAGTGWA